MESKFENDTDKENFNIWLSQTYIKGKGINKKGKFVIVNKQNGRFGNGTYFNLHINSEKFNNWLNDKIKEYKELNLLK